MSDLSDDVELVFTEAARIESRLVPPMMLEVLCSGDDAVFFPTARADYRVVTA